jgi:hypothetical protein
MMRMATLIHARQRGKWEARRPVFRTDFGALDADIVALQETITDDTDEAASMFCSDYHLAQQQDREQAGQGITIASKWPFGQI